MLPTCRIDVIRIKSSDYDLKVMRKKPGFSSVYGIHPIRSLVTDYRSKDSFSQPRLREDVFYERLPIILLKNTPKPLFIKML